MWLSQVTYYFVPESLSHFESNSICCIYLGEWSYVEDIYISNIYAHTHTQTHTHQCNQKRERALQWKLSNTDEMKSSRTQIHGKMYHAHGLEKPISLKCLYHVKQSIDSMQSYHNINDFFTNSNGIRKYTEELKWPWTRKIKLETLQYLTSEPTTRAIVIKITWHWHKN